MLPELPPPPEDRKDGAYLSEYLQVLHGFLSELLDHLEGTPVPEPTEAIEAGWAPMGSGDAYFFNPQKKPVPLKDVPLAVLRHWHIESPHDLHRSRNTERAPGKTAQRDESPS